MQTPHRRCFGPAPAQMQAASGKPGTVQARQPPPDPPIDEPENLRWLYGAVEYWSNIIPSRMAWARTAPRLWDIGSRDYKIWLRSWISIKRKMQMGQTSTS